MITERKPLTGVLVMAGLALLLLPAGSEAQSYAGPTDYGFTEGQYPYYHSPYFYRAYRNGAWGYYPRTLSDPGSAGPNQPILVPPHERSATLILTLPDANATVWIGGKRSAQRGVERKFVSPPLERGASYFYDVRVEWTQDGRKVERTDVVSVRAGQESSLAFFPAPAANTPATPPR